MSREKKQEFFRSEKMPFAVLNCKIPVEKV